MRQMAKKKTSKPAKKTKKKPTKPSNPVGPVSSGSGSSTGQPIFAQPQPSPDPTGFKDPVTDQSEQELTTLGIVPEPVGNAVEPILTLAQVYGSAGAAKTQAIQQAGQIVCASCPQS